MNKERFDNALVVTTEDGVDLKIRVIDIVTKRKGFKKKESVFYVLAKSPFTIYTSYLDETRRGFALPTYLPICG